MSARISFVFFVFSQPDALPKSLARAESLPRFLMNELRELQERAPPTSSSVYCVRVIRS